MPSAPEAFWMIQTHLKGEARVRQEISKGFVLLKESNGSCTPTDDGEATSSLPEAPGLQNMWPSIKAGFALCTGSAGL